MPALKHRRARANAPKPKHPPRHKGLPKGLRSGLRWGALALGLAAVAGGGAWLQTQGHAARALAALHGGAIAASAEMGLRIQNVMVVGRNRAPREDVARALGAERGRLILAFDPHAAKARLETIPWVRAAVVERRLPDTIYLRLVEREPLALWQHAGALALIDREGAVIAGAELARFAHLPLVVGADAAAHAEAIVTILRGQPIVANATATIVRVGARRWDLKLKDGVLVHLPEDAPARAVARLAGLIAREEILARDVIAIDMRLPDRLVVRARPGAAPPSGAGAIKRAAKDT